ncbi:hypothetical protein HDV03_001642 [Kappamyces sp. JEL0829]|nr:hypothetical protein HDV03_001642 [Kappamyces sp. JEL0829]
MMYCGHTHKNMPIKDALEATFAFSDFLRGVKAMYRLGTGLHLDFANFYSDSPHASRMLQVVEAAQLAGLVEIFDRSERTMCQVNYENLKPADLSLVMGSQGMDSGNTVMVKRDDPAFIKMKEDWIKEIF